MRFVTRSKLFKVKISKERHNYTNRSNCKIKVVLKVLCFRQATPLYVRGRGFDSHYKCIMTAFCITISGNDTHTHNNTYLHVHTHAQMHTHNGRHVRRMCGRPTNISSFLRSFCVNCCLLCWSYHLYCQELRLVSLVRRNFKGPWYMELS